MIDVHVHMWTRETVRRSEAARDALAYFRTSEERVPDDLRGIVAVMESAGVKRAFLLGMNCDASSDEALRNLTASNDAIAEAVREHPDLFVGFGSVDPRRGARAVAAVEEAARLELAGLKFHASAVETYPNDEVLMFPLYRKAQAAGLRIIHHTGTTALGRCRIKFARPVHLDDVAQAFPDLRILAAHFGWPWTDECFAVLMRNPNVYTDISGWAPRYLPDAVVTMANGPLKDRILVGSDFPMLSPGPWREEFDRVVAPRLEGDVAQRLLEGNARRFLER